MQSGAATSGRWVLEFEGKNRRTADPLMGWSGSSDFDEQTRIWFESQQQAEKYAVDNNVSYTLYKAQARKRQIKSYADALK